MKWIIEDFVNENENSSKMKKALDVRSVPYLIVKVKGDELIVVNKESFLEEPASSVILHDFLTNATVFVYGSKRLATIAQTMQLCPGSFASDLFNFDHLLHTMKDELLNHDSQIDFIDNLTPTDEPFFIRPNTNSKLINGTVMTTAAFNELKNNLVRKQLHHIEKIVLSPLKKIQAEFRFFVVGNEIAAFSSYKPTTPMPVESSLLNYVQTIIQTYPMNDCYVVDIALVDDQTYKVIEYNNISTSGFYEADVEAIISAFFTTFNQK